MFIPIDSQCVIRYTELSPQLECIMISTIVSILTGAFTIIGIMFVIFYVASGELGRDVVAYMERRKSP